MSLKNEQFNSILRSYDAKRLKSHREFEARRLALYKELPELAALDEQIARGSVACAKRSLCGDSSALAGLRAENEALSAQKTDLLRRHGYPADYLTPHYECPDCKDTGFINGRQCRCFRQAVVDTIYAQSNVRHIITLENFDSFSYRFYSNDYVDESVGMTPLENMRQVVSCARDFIEHFDSEPSNLLIYGNTGVGKTFLSNCIAAELLSTGHTVLYLTAFQLFDLLEQYKFGRSHSYAASVDYEDSIEQFSHILDCDLLIIDDLGTELNNTFVTSQLYLCINERLLSRKSTIISTNLSFEQLQNNYSERIFSRITSSYTFLKIVGEDIRIQKKLD